MAEMQIILCFRLCRYQERTGTWPSVDISATMGSLAAAWFDLRAAPSVDRWRGLLFDPWFFRERGDGIPLDCRGCLVRTAIARVATSGSKSASASASSSSVLMSLYEMSGLPRLLCVRDGVFRFLAGASGEVAASLSTARCCCLLERRGDPARLVLHAGARSDDADRSSSLLGSLYETVPLLRFSVTAMVAQPSVVGRVAAPRRANAWSSSRSLCHGGEVRNCCQWVSHCLCQGDEGEYWWVDVNVGCTRQPRNDDSMRQPCPAALRRATLLDA